MKSSNFLAKLFASLALRKRNSKSYGPGISLIKKASAKEQMDVFYEQLQDQGFSSGQLHIAEYGAIKILNNGTYNKQSVSICGFVMSRYSVKNTDHIAVLLPPGQLTHIDQISIGLIQGGQLKGEIPFQKYVAQDQAAAFVLKLIGPLGGRVVKEGSLKALMFETLKPSN